MRYIDEPNFDSGIGSRSGHHHPVICDGRVPDSVLVIAQEAQGLEEGVVIVICIFPFLKEA